MNNLEIATSYGSKLHDEVLKKNIAKEDHPNIKFEILTHEQLEAAEEKAHDQTIAIGFLTQSDGYGATLADLENDYMKGDVNYSKNMPAAFRILGDVKLHKSGNQEQTRSYTLPCPKVISRRKWQVMIME